MRVVVFGGGGFIGRSVIRCLRERGEEVVCADIDVPAQAGMAVPLNSVDVTEYSAVYDLIDSVTPDRVINLAYILGAGAEDRPETAVRVNCVGMDNVLRAAGELGVGRVVYASSITVYGQAGSHAGRITEDAVSPAAYTQYPNLFYGATKQLNEYQARLHADNSGMSTAAVRPSIVFGHGRESGLTEWASAFVSDPATGGTGHLPFRSEHALSMVHRDDVAELFAAVAIADSLQHHAYNTGGHEVTAGELAAAVEAEVPGSVRLDPSADPSLVPTDLSNQRARHEFGYRLTPLSASIRRHARVAKAA